MAAWAEDRAPWRHDPSAGPGAKTEGGRHDAALSFPFGIGTRAANRPIRIKCTVYLISRPRFLHFTVNHYSDLADTERDWATLWSKREDERQAHMKAAEWHDQRAALYRYSAWRPWYEVPDVPEPSFR